MQTVSTYTLVIQDKVQHQTTNSLQQLDKVKAIILARIHSTDQLWPSKDLKTSAAKETHHLNLLAVQFPIRITGFLKVKDHVKAAYLTTGEQLLRAQAYLK